MRKLNNKGISAIEVVICFSIVSVIAISMLKMVNSFKTKEEVESYKMRVSTFKNTVSRAILKDILDGGGIKKLNDYNEVTIREDTEIPSSNGPITLMDYEFIKITPLTNGYEEEVTFVLNNGSTRVLRIRQIDNDGRDSYLLYNGTYYTLPDMEHLTFNESRILLDHDEEKNYFMKVTIGFNHPDLGNQFDAFDFALPIRENFTSMPNIY